MNDKELNDLKVQCRRSQMILKREIKGMAESFRHYRNLDRALSELEQLRQEKQLLQAELAAFYEEKRAQLRTSLELHTDEPPKAEIPKITIEERNDDRFGTFMYKNGELVRVLDMRKA